MSDIYTGQHGEFYVWIQPGLVGRTERNLKPDLEMVNTGSMKRALGRSELCDQKALRSAWKQQAGSGKRRRLSAGNTFTATGERELSDQVQTQPQCSIENWCRLEFGRSSKKLVVYNTAETIDTPLGSPGATKSWSNQ